MKAYIKQHFDGIYRTMSKARRNNVVRAITSFPNKTRSRMLISMQKPHVCIDIKGAMGFGAMLTVTASIFNYCQKNNFFPNVRWTNPLYGLDGEDWLERYFNRNTPQFNMLYSAFYSFADVPTNDRWQTGLTIERANHLFNQYLTLKDEWILEGIRLAEEKFEHQMTLGVHFRGTDKAAEAPRISWETVQQAVDVSLDEGLTRIFVATDEPRFLNMMVGRYGRSRIADLDCQEIHDDTPAHVAKGDPYRKGYEALMTILILSKCAKVVRTPSHLSAWSKIMNPQLNFISLGKPYQESFWFPEREFWKIPSPESAYASASQSS
jgi:hypothetical protein